VHPNDPESYAGGRESSPCQRGQKVRARRSVVPAPPGWGLGMVLMTPPQKSLLLRNHGGGQDPKRVVEPVKKERKRGGTRMTSVPFVIKWKMSCVSF
jgi:hypothetical protein